MLFVADRRQRQLEMLRRWNSRLFWLTAIGAARAMATLEKAWKHSARGRHSLQRSAHVARQSRATACVSSYRLIEDIF